MENLKQKIQADLTNAIKSGNEISRSTLRLLSAAILNKEKEKRYKIVKGKPDLTEKELVKEASLTDEEVTEVISSEVKKRKESILEFKKGKREDLANKEKAEMEILQKYLPEQLSEEELKKLVKEAIVKIMGKEIHPVKSADKVGGVPPEAEQFNRVKDIGRVMAEIMPKVKGKADGSEVSRIVKEILSSSRE